MARHQPEPTNSPGLALKNLRFHCFVERITRSMQTFKSCTSAASTLAGVEVAYMIHKDQFGQIGQSGIATFAQIAG